MSFYFVLYETEVGKKESFLVCAESANQAWSDAMEQIKDTNDYKFWIVDFKKVEG